MVRIDLDQEGAEVLARVLKNYLPDLRFEISNTERMEFREGLKADEDRIKAIVEDLSKQGIA
jgi:hypothetical protein